MSRFNGFGWRLTATVLAALVGAVIFPASVGAAPKTNSLSGQAVNGTGALSFNGAIHSDSDGSAVRGTFQVKTQLGNVTVDATCLEVVAGIGGRIAGAAGAVKASTDPSLPVGAAVAVQAFDSDTSAVPDGLTLFLLGQVPGPNQCSPPSSPASPVSKGKLTIRQGV